MSDNGIKSEDVFQILLATDCHLGYMERDAVRGSDSITTFEEILDIAVEKDVDFILLGGDLFHENKPSRKTLHQCMKLLRTYCMGERAVQFEILSDQYENFKHSGANNVNYEDPNLNVSFPVFSIHGNHDDPAGSGSYCTLDILGVTGLVNYFGKCTDLEKIEVKPVLLKKGCTRLALYGLGSIRDERLHRLFREGSVSLLRPREHADEWFNVFVLHQNRMKHGPTNYIPENFLHDFLDLVIWGHEHECRILEEWNGQQNFYVTQPGSSVATSLCHGEAVPKHVGLLQIHKNTFKITQIPLRTVRQFYIKDIDLDDVSLNLNEPDSSEKVSDYCKEVVEEFLRKAAFERSGHPKQPEKPLIRLRVYYPENFETFSVQRFGQCFVDKVANPKDILLFTRKKVEKEKVSAMDVDALKTILKQEGIDKSRVEDLVKEYFQLAEEKKQLSLLSECGISNAVREYVDKEVSEAISVLVDHQLKKVQDHLRSHQVPEDLVEEGIGNFRKERLKDSAQEMSELQDALRKNKSSSTSGNHEGRDNSDFMDDDEEVPVTSSKARGRGRGRGRGSRGGRGRGKANSSAVTSNTGSETRPNSRSSRASSRANSSRTSTKKDQSESSWRMSGKQKNITSFFNADSDVECIEESDDDASRSKTNTSSRQSTGNKRRGVFYDSDSDS